MAVTRSRLLPLALGAASIAWFFRAVLVGDEMFAFRDVAHFYHPLYEFVQAEWAAGRAPLWNPLEDLGRPLAADPTAAAFYPGKAVFALPLGYDGCFRLYVVGHVALAAWAAYVAARRFGASIEGATVAALSYAFSGGVLFQYCNVIYLVGAAWLPLALVAADGMLRGARGQGSGVRAQGEPLAASHPGASRSASRGASCIALGVVLAMIVLGGDVQTACHVVLLVALYALVLWWHGRGEAGGGESAGSLLVRIGVACLVALALSAIQVLPSWDLTSRSAREAGTWAERLTARPQPGTHAEHTYEFSVAPWRLAELLWPNLGGRQFPVHRRWMATIPAEGRVWTPTLYMGAATLALALGVMRLRHRGQGSGVRGQGGLFSRRVHAAQAPAARGFAADSPPNDAPVAWLSWVVVLSLVAALGGYGLGWLAAEATAALGGDAAKLPVGPPAGGLYWLMTLVVPGYARFRYPAKWLVVAALGLSLLAARGWDESLAGRSDRARRTLAWLLAASVLAAVVALAVRPFWSGWLSGARPDVLFGPLDAAGAWRDVFFGFVQTAVVCAAFRWFLSRASRPSPLTPHPSPHAWLRAAALVLVAVDLAWANGWLVVTAPAEMWRRPSAAAAAIRAETPGGSPRVWRHPIWMPREFAAASSPDRLAESLRWDRDTLFPKHHLGQEIRIVEVEGAIALRPAGDVAPDPSLLAEFAILPGNRQLPRGLPIAPVAPDAVLWRNPGAMPRVFVVKGSGVGGRGSGESRSRLRNEFQRSADETCRIVRDEPSCVEVEATLVAPGRVVLADRFDPGWTLQVTTAGQGSRGAKIEPFDGLLRAVDLPAGTHRLVFRYRPATFVWGAALSGAAWLGLVLTAAAALGKRLYGLPRNRSAIPA